MSSVHVKGLAELQKALDTLPAKIQINVLRGAMRAGAKPILTEAQRTTDFIDRSGALRASLRISTATKGDYVRASVVSGPSKKDKRPFYGRFIEYGTKAHVIKAKLGGVLSFLGGSFASVNHPGIRPRPYMRTALDTQAQPAVHAAGEYIRKRLATKHGIDVPAPLEEGDE